MVDTIGVTGEKRQIPSATLARRTFLMAGMGAMVAGLALRGGSSVHAAVTAHQEGSSPLVVGQKTHRYEWLRGWGRLPQGMTLGSTHGAVQVDSRNRVYFNTDTENSILVFAEDGTFLRAMGAEWKGGTHGMVIRQEGKEEFLYLTNLARSEFAKLTLEGRVVWVKGYPAAAELYTASTEFKPTGIAFAPNGGFYVTDGYGKNFVHQYSAEGEYLRSWGGKGKEDGKFNTPHAILVDTRGERPYVLVTDRANHRLQWFTLDGEHHQTLDGSEDDLLRLPATLAQRGEDLVVGDLAGRLTILDGQNRLITHLGDNLDPKKRATNRLPETEWLDGQFIAPHGVCWDRDGNLYVEEWMAIGRIVKLRRLP
jgi:DNA-binding beta-propeller fold protein YncE